MLYTKFQSYQSIGSGKEDFLKSFTRFYKAWRPYLSLDLDGLKHIFAFPPLEALSKILLQLIYRTFDEMFKIVKIESLGQKSKNDLYFLYSQSFMY